MARHNDLCAVVFAAAAAGCLSAEPAGLAPAAGADTTVKMDFFHRPLPEIPLPNDIATVVDPSSATGIRINASMVAPTGWERTTRELIDRLDGWGVFQPIAIPFTGPLDVQSVIDGHRDADYALDDDVVYVIDVDRDSEQFGTVYPLDLGNGNYPVVLEDRDRYGKHDPRAETMSLMFEEYAEDVDGDGQLDPGEDSDADGVLDVPNYLPGQAPAWTDLAARADALMTFYERETNTLLVRTLEPLQERTTYAVVVTRRLRDAGGRPVGSPFRWINHTAQTEALRPLLEVMPDGLSVDDVAFAFSFTTQTIEQEMVAVRDGLYGHGVQAHLGAEFPAVVDTLEPMRDDQEVPDLERAFILPAESWSEFWPLLNQALLDGDEASQQYATAVAALRYVDFFAVGSFQSPQLFARVDDAGRPLPLNEQSWPADLDRLPATARSERVFFSLMVPRKEVSARGEGAPAPLVIYGHGHGSNRFEMFLLGMEWAKHGFAVLSIDAPSHGVDLSPAEHTQVMNLFRGGGIGTAGEALLTGRALDHDADGVLDSGTDFWTSDLFHTRDILRQYVLDLMQTVRVVRAFDGDARWPFDVDRDGDVDLAGDFDGDGAIDIGGTAPIYMAGGSLGGITTMLVGSLEPEIDAIAPIVGGGGLADIGFRSHNGSLPASMFVSGAMGSIYAGTLDPATGELVIEASVARRLRVEAIELGRVEGVSAGDILVAENLVNGAVGCGIVTADGRVRAAVESDRGDATRLTFHAGARIVPGTHCQLDGGHTVATLDRLGASFEFYGRDYRSGEPLTALGFGLARGRATPDLRRMQMLSQLVLDRADPAAYARHLLREPLLYPGTGQTTGAHTLSVTTLGDMNVTASSGIAFARAAGLIDYRTADPRFGKPVNQVLIDTYTTEGVHNLGRYTAPDGSGVHLDVENFSDGDDSWTGIVPRLDPPLRIGLDRTDPLGGTSAVLFPLTDSQGMHGFYGPGELTDIARAECAATCPGPELDDCDCAEITRFDPALFVLNMVAHYFASGGRDIPTERCQSSNDCAAFPAPPPTRDPADRR